MSKRDNTILWVAGAVAVGWFLAPKELKEQITGGVPGIGIDLSNFGGLLPSGLGGIGGIGGIGGGGISEQWFTDWWAANKPDLIPSEIPLLDTTGIIQDILDAGDTAAGVVGKAVTDALAVIPPGEQGGQVAPTPPTIPSPWEEFTALHPIVKNVIAGVAGVGGVYGAVKGIQAVAPAVRITTDAMARTFAAVLRGKNPPIGKLPIVKPSIPWWGKTPLGKQWISKTSLGKIFGKGVGRAGGLGLAPLGIMDIIQEFDWSLGPLGRGWGAGWTGKESADVTIPWTSATWNLKPQPEGVYRKQPVPMRAERPSPQPLTLTQKYGKTETKKPLYKPPLEGVQW